MPGAAAPVPVKAIAEPQPAPNTMSRDYLLQPFRPITDLQIDYRRELNPQQQAAVTAPPGPALVIAGAGAGKTRTLTYRVAYLLEQGIPPDRILLLTFTNKAAKEMMRRVGDLLGNDVNPVWGGTFHAIGNRILRRHAVALGYPQDFTIVDREDSNDLLKACLADAGVDVKATRFPKADVLADIFSLAANREQSIPLILEEGYDYFASLAEPIREIHGRYVERKRAAGAMDFDDLLTLWLRLLRDHNEVRESYQRRFQFVLVDEYQDTNRLQSDLIDLLAERHRNVMVVGDDSQSIYSWRGADFRNILEFPRRYPEARVYKIETNYRSTPEILEVANAAISANVNQFAKTLVPARRSGARPALIVCGDAGEQAAFVAQRALELRDGGTNLSEMAVLYRSHFHALELQLELTRRNIPFSITSGIRFFEQAHIKDVAAHLRLVSNPQDEPAFKRLARLLPGIGGKTANSLWHLFVRHWQEVNKPASLPDGSPAKHKPGVLAAALQTCAPRIPKKAAVPWAQFTATIAQLDVETIRAQPSAMIRVVLEAGYEDYLQENYSNYRVRVEDLEQLATFALQFSSREAFLTQLALLTNLEAEEGRPARDDTGQLRLSTIHQAKGLEFAVVFVIMLCEGLFPSARSLTTPEGEEEERRLFYVALTRAKDTLHLSYPLIRLAQGQGADAMQQPSRFLKEIPLHLVEEWNLHSF